MSKDCTVEGYDAHTETIHWCKLEEGHDGNHECGSCSAEWTDEND